VETDMNKTLLLGSAATALLLLGACGEREVPPAAGSGNELLSYVPAETPYLLANLEPPPEEVIDVYLDRLQPVLDSMQSQLSRARAGMEQDSATRDAAGDSEPAPRSQQPGVHFTHALLKELDGKLNRAGLESMGFDLRSHKVLYGMGAFPVVRLGLADPVALRATIDRILDAAGIDVPEQSFQGRGFWRLSDDDAEAHAGLYIAVLDDHLAISFFPPMAEQELLPLFLGLQLPDNSDAAARLAELNAGHGYTPHGSGILDLRLLADRFLQPGTVASRVLAEAGVFDAETLPEVCVTEIHGIIENTPRITMGTTELSPSAIAVQYRVDTPATLADQLTGLVARIPAIDAASTKALEFAFGMKFGAVRDFLREKAAAIDSDPYQCEHLADINDRAAEALAGLEQPMPPFVNNFRGLRISLSEIIFGDDMVPETARGHVAVHVEQPQMFVGMAQMFLPDLSELSIAPGEPPVRLPESLAPMPETATFAAMSDEAIGLAVGEGEEAELPEFLDRKPGPKGVFMAANYDMANYLDYTGAQTVRLGDSTGHAGDSERSDQAVTEIRDAATAAFRDMADRSSMTLRFTNDGFAADNRITFK
jgi:hypothetical protein